MWPALVLVIVVGTSASFSPLVKTVAFSIDNRDKYPSPLERDGVVHEGRAIYYQDFDQDGWGSDKFIISDRFPPIGYSSRTGDCDDGNSFANPGRPEVCYTPFDDNCDGVINESCQTFFRDNDEDGWGNEFQRVFEMTQPPGFVRVDSDCDDDNPAVNPAAQEVPDGIDNNCDGQIDEESQTYYRDADEDGYGDANVTISATSQPDGYVTNKIDCNDYDAAINPFATEICNFKDDDCDGQVDEGCHIYYRDSDADGYGNWNIQTRAMAQPAGYSSIGGDCDDFNPFIHPGGLEICNFKDDNCNGHVDEGCQVFYRDADADGYGLWNMQTRAMTQPAGYSSIGGDCDDGNANIHPGASELCNGINDDCDGLTDEGCPGSNANLRAEQKESINIVGLSLAVYPNPANRIFTLRVDGDRKQGKLSLRIMSHLGEIKETRNNIDVTQTINLGAGYPAGTYFIEATQGTTKKVIKVVKTN